MLWRMQKKHPFFMEYTYILHGKRIDLIFSPNWWQPLETLCSSLIEKYLQEKKRGQSPFVL